MDILIGLLISLGVINGFGDVNAQISKNQTSFDKIGAAFSVGSSVSATRADGGWSVVVGGGGVINRADIIWND